MSENQRILVPVVLTGQEALSQFEFVAGNLKMRPKELLAAMNRCANRLKNKQRPPDEVEKVIAASVALAEMVIKGISFEPVVSSDLEEMQ